ncbi:MAG: CRISPR-associated endonuclease Cas9 [Succiniclasticum sp.]
MGYYLGLDVGTSSVGYAVTDEQYHLRKFHGEPMWGSHVFEEAKPSSDRRAFRTARRRLNRRQQRVQLVQEIFAREIAKVDPRFFIRLQQSRLHREDVDAKDRNLLFNDAMYTDKEYYAQYPTIHHLLLDLMQSDAPHDVRLVYLAVAWLVAHRGHFLSEVDRDNIAAVLQFDEVYQDFQSTLQMYGLEPWACDTQKLQEVLLQRKRIKDQQKDLEALIYPGQKLRPEEDDLVDKKVMLNLLAGGTVSLEKLFPQLELEESKKISFQDPEEKVEEALQVLDKEAELVVQLRRMYDWALLKQSLQGSLSVSEAKVKVYEQHRRDLADLKGFVRRNAPKKYNRIFRTMDGKDSLANYVAYSYELSNVKGKVLPKKKATQAEFCDFLKKELANISCSGEDKALYESMKARWEDHTFLPKQVNGDNRIIPYQLYYHELKTLLEKAESYLPFLSVEDADGLTPEQKLLSIMTFRIPYFVGPLCKRHSDIAWIERKAEGKIYPWNFDEKVDLDASEAAFIRKMTNKCTYLPDQPVLPMQSLLYERFMVLNEINNLKVNGMPITVEAKQDIYQLFTQKRKVTRKAVEAFLLSNGWMERGDIVSGVDVTIKSALTSLHDFRSLLERKVLTQDEVEEIVEHLTYTEDRKRNQQWLQEKFPQLDEQDVKYVSKLKYEEFGRLSREFLSGVQGVDEETGEKNSIIGFLWGTNDNLMQLLSDRYTFADEVERRQTEYYKESGDHLEDLLDDMQVSSLVKRPIYRTLDIVRDVCKACKEAPEKIFVEMARGTKVKQERKKSRRDMLKELYKEVKTKDCAEVDRMVSELEGKSDRQLRSDALYLYFVQLGKDMYSGDPIDLENIKDRKRYDIDHIYPQSVVKDDSLDNRVLTATEINGQKGNRYPLDPAIQHRMALFWKMLKEKGLISEKKYNRLMRTSPFTPDERWGFINRQLVETSQATKALATVLQRKFPQAKIVYVKAGLVSNFRHEYDLVKSRLVNDLHHAKDAYLNIVVGNVYDTRFNKQWFRVDEPYSVKLKTLFKHPVQARKNSPVVWNGEEDIGRIKDTVAQNNVHYTRYAFVRKGGFFDQMPVKAAPGFIPLKKGLDTEKYGGYNKATASFYCFVAFDIVVKKSTKREAMLVPVALHEAAFVENDKSYAEEYLRNTIAQIINQEPDCIQKIAFPLGMRKLKINTVLSLDGFRVAMAGKDSGGSRFLAPSLMPLCVTREQEQYIKRLESFRKKMDSNQEITVDEKYDGITLEKNIDLYDFFVTKLQQRPYSNFLLLKTALETLKDGREIFLSLTTEKQVESLLSVLNLFATGRTQGCDLSSIGGAAHAAAMPMAAKFSGYKGKYKTIRIINVSASGLFESKTKNLLEYL